MDMIHLDDIDTLQYLVSLLDSDATSIFDDSEDDAEGISEAQEPQEIIERNERSTSS
jgi:hypothetical protein